MSIDELNDNEQPDQSKLYDVERRSSSGVYEMAAPLPDDDRQPARGNWNQRVRCRNQKPAKIELLLFVRMNNYYIAAAALKH